MTRSVETILAQHAKWLRGEGGRRLVWADLDAKERADLSGPDLSRADLSRADLSGAILWRADLSRADLSGAILWRADLSRADLSGANLSRADLSGAILWRADLSGANLSRADLSRANLSGADLWPGLAIIQGPIRSDGYAFSLRACCFGEHVVVAGFRSFTIAEYRAHVADNYPDTPKAAETLAILDFLEARLTQTFAAWSTPNDA